VRRRWWRLAGIRRSTGSVPGRIRDGDGKAVDDGTRSVLDDLAAKAREVQTELSSVALWPSILFVTMVLVGLTLPGRFRFEVQNRPLSAP